MTLSGAHGHSLIGGAHSQPMHNEQEPITPALPELIAQFAGHVFFGTLGFIILAIPAITLSLLAHYLEDTFISIIVIWILISLHYFIFIVDAAMFVAYITVSIYAAARELRRHVRRLR